MKHLKIYEGYNMPEIGDYVICDITPGQYDEFRELKDFLIVNIGLIIYAPKYSDEYDYVISFDNLPKNLDSMFGSNTKNGRGLKFSIDEIKHFSKDKEKMKIILSSNKFNI